MKHYAVILSLLLCFALLLGCGAAQTESKDPVESVDVQDTPETTPDEPTDVEPTDPEDSTESPEGTELPEEPTEETEEPEEADPEVEEVPPALEHPLAVQPVNEKVALTDPMADGTYAVTFAPEDMMNVGDTFFLTAEFFDYDRYDAAVVEQLQAGDTIEVCGETVSVEEVNILRDEGTGYIYYIEINGGMEYGGVSLLQVADAGIYRTSSYSNYPVYYPLGEMGCVISHDIVLSDQGDDPSNEPVEADFSALPGWVEDLGYFYEHFTTITIADGEVIRIDRAYAP